MKKAFLFVILSLFAVSCNSSFNEAMKSADKNFILKTANELYAQKKWKNALALYDRLPKLLAGTDELPNLGFNTAYANYYDKNYRLAGHQFKNFANTFVDDPRREEAAYMSALCYYKGLFEYNLDQTTTDLALNEMQEFMNNFPDSERAKNINTLIEELMSRQELKAYENARQYYKMGQYKATAIAFENVLEDYPSTKLRPKIYDYIQRAKYELAMNSKYDLKEDRLKEALVYTKFVEKELPNTTYAKTAFSLGKRLEEEIKNFASIKVTVEKQRAEQTLKAETERVKEENKEKKIKDRKVKKQQQINAKQALIVNEPEKKNDSIQVDPTEKEQQETTFKIRR